MHLLYDKKEKQKQTKKKNKKKKNKKKTKKNIVIRTYFFLTNPKSIRQLMKDIYLSVSFS